MIARSFKSVLWVATVGGAALGCYMVSLKVATERADLTKVERQIVSTERDIRSLQTELGTRGRLAQLEDWNANVLALSAPAANQFLPDHVTLARLEQHDETVEERGAKVQMAALETGAARTPEARPAAPAKGEPQVAAKLPKIIRAVQTAAAPRVEPSLLRQASFTTASAAPLHVPAAVHPVRSARIESIASEIGAAATRGEHVEKTGRERSAGTR
jgi:hypothetical protein